MSAVDHPEHYNNGGIECIDALVAARGREAVCEFCLCNAMKYIWRLGHKDDSVQEARKAIWYLNKYVELMDEPIADIADLRDIINNELVK